MSISEFRKKKNKPKGPTLVHAAAAGTRVGPFGLTLVHAAAAGSHLIWTNQNGGNRKDGNKDRECAQTENGLGCV